MKATRQVRVQVWMAASLLVAIAPCRAAPCPVVPGLVAPGHLTMATNPTLPPLQYMSVDGDLSGMRIVLGREVARRLCLEPAFLSTSFAQLTLGLLEKRWDVIDTGMFYTPQRATLMEMVPYEIQAISLSVADDAPMVVRGVDDLAGRSLGVEMGGIEERHAREIDRVLREAGKPGLDIKTFQNVGIAFAALRAHQVFAVFSIDAVAQRGVAQGGVRRDLHGLYPTPVALALRDAALADRVAGALSAMRADGTLERIMAPYGVSAISGRIEASGPGRLSNRY
ncbi:transporter substrate-binding domain-containing protein [Gluconacetobacter asukensis]|uniref:Transporter substrate-binding domain-containing protein n=1 Tax=Gluconacetobacter asukensis TaxID=1017181 RepID=A0A7W4J1S8_9PROT|nr:transporter substrate-binding domain-containing protein [Gluconacetobacter asukensis]MBB2173133.1 transporter substrate-binding domain-containing protein [Gluconacetobacter asukensis]